MQRKPITPQMALSRLATLCARAERCRFELEQKLRQWGVRPSDSEQILARLARERYFDDSRFAAAFARDKALYAHWGRRKIDAALRVKHISATDIADALDSLDEDEYRAALSATINAKARTLPEIQSYESRSKLYRFALTRGYEPALALAYIKSLTP